MRLLIAEDDAISRVILQKAVQKLGHDCLVAQDGAEAWRVFQDAGVDAVISDWMMPGLDGVELCRRVRASASDTYPYFILLTALGDKEHLLAGLQAGADDYLTKPLDRDELQVRLIAAARVTSLYRQLAEQKREVERLNHRLFEQARRDPLTQLRNRLQLQEDLEALRGLVARYGHRYGVVLCDVDHFKRYNDAYGHLAGDDVLRAVAATITRICRSGDLAYRYGGEEFLLLLPQQALDGAAAVVERLRGAVEALAIPHEAKPAPDAVTMVVDPSERIQAAPSPAQPAPGVVTISAGVAALAPGGPKSVEDLLREADAALYRAKEAGRNRVAVYGETGRLSCGP
jgi:diguanylate cyclase (GGDEF)-like protein